MPSDTKGTVKLKNGKAVISMGTMKEPGFRDCRLTKDFNTWDELFRWFLWKRRKSSLQKRSDD